MNTRKRIVLNSARDVTLSPYLVTEERKRTFLIAPGGAYSTCDERESAPVAKRLNALGYNCFIFRYSVGKQYKWPYPLEDFECAMDYLVRHAGEYHIIPERIVAVGFSAGGHVVVAGAGQVRHRPFAAVLAYGLVDRETLQFCAPDAPGADTCITLDTPPMFLAYSRNDWIVPIHNAEKLMAALREHYVDYEAHIYAYAMHGFTVGSGVGAKGPLYCGRIDNWVADCMAWLDELDSGRYRSVREGAPYQDRYARQLSTRNSCARLEQHPEAIALLKRKFPVQYAIYAAAKRQVGGFLETVSLRNLMELVRTSDATLQKMDDALARLPMQIKQIDTNGAGEGGK